MIEAMKIEQAKNELQENRKKVLNYSTQISAIPIRIMSAKEREEKRESNQNNCVKDHVFGSKVSPVFAKMRGHADPEHNDSRNGAYARTKNFPDINSPRSPELASLKKDQNYVMKVFNELSPDKND
jgi:hypothetical protein